MRYVTILATITRSEKKGERKEKRDRVTGLRGWKVNSTTNSRFCFGIKGICAYFAAYIYIITLADSQKGV